MVESIKGKSCDDLRYGITTVHPNRAIKKCRIRNLMIEYYLSEIAVVLVIPKSCGDCDRVNDCTDDFILQIMEKSYSYSKDSNAANYFL